MADLSPEDVNARIEAGNVADCLEWAHDMAGPALGNRSLTDAAATQVARALLSLAAENAELREQLRLATIPKANAEAEVSNPLWREWLADRAGLGLEDLAHEFQEESEGSAEIQLHYGASENGDLCWFAQIFWNGVAGRWEDAIGNWSPELALAGAIERCPHRPESAADRLAEKKEDA